MLFIFKADTSFYADDLDDACRILSEHFKALTEGEDSPLQMEEGEIHLHAVKE